MFRSRAAIVAMLALVACRTTPKGDEWPALPKTNEDARRILASTGTRPTTESDAALEAEVTVPFVKTSVTSAMTVMGWEAIDAQLVRWITALPDKNTVVAFGTSHDSPAQIDAFRRIVGPRSTVGWTRITLEQLYADGRWRSLDGSTQTGDDAALDRYAKSGARDDISSILNRVQRDAYTAWKYGSVDVIGDLIAEARASGRPVSGCDMAPALRARFTASLDESWVHHMREVHCALAIRDRAKREGGVQRIAALWGRMHVHHDRFPRLLPPEWSAFSVSIVNAPDSAEVVLVDPIYVNGKLVLPSADAAKHFERKRTKTPGAETSSFSGKGTAWIDGRDFVGTMTLASGRHVLAVDKGGTLIAAAIEVPPHGGVQVTVADDAPEVTATTMTP